MADRPGAEPGDVAQALALLDDFIRAHLYASDGDLEFAPAGPSDGDAAPDPLAAAALAARLSVARTLLAARRLRSSFFDLPLAAEPSHDILLELYVRQMEGDEPSLSALRLMPNLPRSTALRWVAILVDDNVLEQVPGPGGDSIRLSRDTLDRLGRYLDAVVRETP
ncbi:hypothetical protein [Sphingomonas sp. ID0503]|uniref:hypothetical protein n=1 Tax=Sphingomonas sp. ID0503 TaxID=3399691 RepID=UPI003AFA36E8